MSKKLIAGIVVIIVVVIIAVLALTFLKGNKNKPSDEAMQMAETLQDFMPAIL